MLLPASALTLAVKLAAGVLGDRLFGEVRRLHPLVGFGHWAQWTEALLRRWSGGQRLAGVLAWLLAVLPWLSLALLLRSLHPLAHWPVDIILLYFALGGRSLTEHAEAIAQALATANLELARERAACIVSRDTAQLDAVGVARAGTESVLENGNDAVFGALFWFAIGAGPGVLLFRLANTLDAMWGYRTPAYRQFGWAAARIDDLLNLLPARLTALTYALLGRTRRALACWRRQAHNWDSPNAGPVMAAGAGALGVSLGGAARYHGHEQLRPPLGEGSQPDAASIHAAIALVRRGTLLWLGLAAAAALFVLALSNA